MTYPCPYCTSPASPETGCPSCGRDPDPDAADVVRSDAEIAVLTAEIGAARLAVTDLETRLGRAWDRRHAAAARVRASVLAATQPGFPPMPAPVAPAWAAAAPAPRDREASTKLVQNALFLLGGLLLAVAAIVFTAVAWAQFGVGGRALLLASGTAAALAAPPLALRRRLTATAETFAAVGLLLVLLDGYAAWYVNLFGVADGSPWGYAGAVCAVTAAVAAGYEHLTGLSGPRFAALLVAQPVLPLLAVPAHPDAAGWSLTFAGVAALDLAVLVGRRFRFSAFVVVTWGSGAAALAVAVFGALVALGTARAPAAGAIAGAALLAAALVPVAGSILARHAVAQSVAGGLFVVALDLAAARYAVLLGPGSGLLRVAVVTLIVAVLVAGARRLLPPVVARGPLAGVLAVIAGPALGAVALTVVAAWRSFDTARPFLDAAWTAKVAYAGWQLPVVIAVLAVALLVTLPAVARRETVLTAGALAALALPAALHLRWWCASILDLAVVTAALLLAVRYAGPAPAAASAARPAPAGPAPAAEGPAGPAPAVVEPAGPPVVGSLFVGPAGRVAAAPAVVSPALVSFTGQVLIALLLGMHAVAAGFGRAGVAVGVLAAVVVLGIGVAAVTRTGPRRRDLGGAGLLLGLLAAPATVWATTSALSAPAVLQSRIALAAALLPLVARLILDRRGSDRSSFALAATLLTIVSTPVWALAGGDSAAVYAALALVIVALTLPGTATRLAKAKPVRTPTEAGAAALTATPLALALLITTGASLSTVLLSPYGWLGSIWTGRPAASAHLPAAAPVALLLLAVAAALAGRVLRDRRTAAWSAAPILAVTVPLALAAAGVGWPGVPAAELLLGLAGLLAATRRPVPAPVPVVAALLAAPGLAGLLPTRALTLAGLGAVLVAAVVAGVSGRARPARLAGWLVAVAAAVAVAGTAAGAFGVGAAFPVLGAGAATLAVAWLLVDRRAAEARAVEAAAHATAVLALLLTAGSATRAALVCSLWGAALGIRALRPAARSAYVLAAAGAELAGWVLLMAAAHVTTPEVYTVPAAVVALLAGLSARRARSGLSSWTAFGPALAAAFLPSLATIAGADGQYSRRLLLGLAALAVVVVGANARLRAPVVLGGGVLLLVALHEVAQVWDLVPRWIPLAAGGLVLVVLAMTLERRRRDLQRFREALTRMT